MCAVVFTHNPMRSVKQRITTGTLGLAITAIILAVTTIVDVIIINVTGDYYYGYYFYYFFYGFGSIIVLGIISFFAYIALLGSYIILGASFLKIGDMTLKDAEKARLAGIFLIIGAVFEGIGVITRFFEFGIFGVGNYILIIATAFYFTGFFLIIKVYNSMFNEKLIAKKLTPVILFAPVFYFFKTLTTIIIFATESIDYLTYLNIDSGLSLLTYTILAVGMFLFYYSTNNIDDGEAFKFFKPEGQPIYQPYVQPYQAPPQQVSYSPQTQNQTQVQYCPNCGNQINIKDTFCSSCGQKLRDK